MLLTCPSCPAGQSLIVIAIAQPPGYPRPWPVCMAHQVAALIAGWDPQPLESEKGIARMAELGADQVQP